MLTILGRKQGGFCDGLSRRGFLRIGALGLGALALNLRDLLAAEDAQQSTSPHKAVIHVFLGGGPPHQDMWDIKTEAPAEIRGEFAPDSHDDSRCADRRGLSGDRLAVRQVRGDPHRGWRRGSP